MTHLPVDFSAFHQMHRPAYVRWAHSYLGHRADAEEAVDGAFEQLLKAWPAVLSSENPAGYAWTVLRNNTIDVYRRGRRALPLEMAAFETAALLGTADPIGQFEESSALMAAVRQLPSRQMDIMMLLYLHDLGVRQVADELGISPATVRSSARHAKRRLHQLLTHPAPDTTEGHPDDVAH
ncbi:RNA polymerase sigma factor [Streptomyces sp. NBC_01304]|uniref:RNA polymerase sigma factor n=1 Tax=Streptomyces sp. NBC_01304 TaxID=2903818 RepID=UPI002E153820|nr:sigma-70 family RNA polymerase sigma factor [Streptomyces sp. NBC_01304]